MKPILVGMAVHNQWQVTLDCVRSILNSLSADHYELVIVDNASTEPAPEAIKRLADAGLLEILRNEKNLYCARAWNQIWKRAEPGQVVVIINNDIEVTTGFLQELHRTAALYPGIATTRVFGLAKPEQQKPLIPGVVQILPRGFHHLSGIVFSGLRETFERVGGFDEKYQTPWFEDDDFWMTCHSRGVPVLIAPVMVHHRGEVTSKAVSFDRMANKRYFYEKWRRELGQEAEEELAALPLIPS